ncbi:MAG: RHS repeat-associated core domain-containing protein [Ruminococcaceae bacterium]|nr:RHS repeat-associated core domain-containing protein [Oscillospiraceae bacterium]
MKKKLWLRILSVLLSIILCVQLGTTIVFAEEEPQIEPSTSTETVEENPIICEVTELRDATTKYFLHEDHKTVTAARYPTPVHYQKNNEWQDIDNTMIDADASANGELKPTTDHFYFRLGKKTKGHILTIGEEDEQVKFQLLDANNVDAVKLNEETSSDDPQMLENVTSSVLYESVFDGVDLRFDIGGAAIKDNFILENADATNVFKYKIIAGKNTLVSNEDGSISILTSENEELYRLTAPTMYDAVGAHNENITQTITEHGNNYILTITADKEWLAASEREYPVTIDPMVDLYTNFTSGVDSLIGFHNRLGGDFSINYDVGYLSKIYNVYLKFKLPVLDLDMIGDQLLVTNVAAIGTVIQYAEVNVPIYNYFESVPNADIYFSARELTQDLGTYVNSTYINPTYPIYSNNIEDYFVLTTYSDDSQYLSANITDTVKNWYSNPNSNNLGLAMVADVYNDDHAKDAMISLFSSGSPVLRVQYGSIVGLEDYYSYTSASIDGCGTAYVNNATGELCYAFTDYTSANKLSGVNISHVYNDSVAVNGVYNYHDVYVGTGFQLSIQESMEYRDHMDDFIYYDSDGTMHFFSAYDHDNNEETDPIYVDESGLNRTVDLATDFSVTMTYEDGTQKYFNRSGYLTQIIDKNGNKAVIEYSSGSFTGSYVPVKIYEYYNNNANYRTTTLTWDANNYLTRITGHDGSYATYSYSGEQLQSVTFSNYLNYNSSSTSGVGNRLILTFSYENLVFNDETVTLLTQVNGNIDCANITIYRADGLQVFSIESSQGDASSGTLYKPSDYLFEYGRGITRVDKQGTEYYVTYVFDSFGRATIANDIYGNAVSSGYNDDNKLEFQSDMQSITENYYIGGNAEENSILSAASTYSGVSMDSSNAYMGDAALALATGGSITQQITVPQSGNYSFGAYVKTGGSVTFSVAGVSETFYGDSTYENYFISAYLTGGTNYSFTISSQGTSYIDNIQVLHGYSSVPFNVLKNANFKQSLSSSNWDIYRGFTNYPSITNGTLKIEGDIKTDKQLRQTIYVQGNAGDTIVFGGRLKTDVIPENEFLGSNVTLRLEILDGSNDPVECEVIPDSKGLWQAVMDSATAIANFSVVELYLVCSHTSGTVYFDDLFVYKNGWGTSYEYDDNGHLSSMTNSKAITSNTAFNASGDLTSSTDALGKETTYEYDNKRNYLRSIAEDGFKAESYQYDSAGNVLASYTGSSDADVYTRNSLNTYDYGLLLKSSRDAAGNVTNYTHNMLTLNTTAVEAPNGSVTNYGYYNNNSTVENGPLKSVGVAGENGFNLSSVSYSYTDGALSQINRGNIMYFLSTDYGFYDGIQVADDYYVAPVTDATSVGSLQLNRNYYNELGELIKTVYGQDFDDLGTQGYIYDDLGRLTYSEIGKNYDTPIAKAYYSYQHNNLLSSVREPSLGYTTRFVYDDLGNITQSKYLNSSGTGNTHTYEYDVGDRLTQNKTVLTESVDSSKVSKTFKNVYEYKNNTDLLERQLNQNATSNILPEINYSYDLLHRPTNNRIETVSGVPLTNQLYSAWSYKDGSTDASGTTFDISQYRIRVADEDIQPTADYVYNYTYDSMGNITRISNAGYRNSSGSSTFAYDDLNQLTSASIYRGTGSNYNESFTYVNEGTSSAPNYHGNIASVNKNGTTYTYNYQSGMVEEEPWPDLITHITSSNADEATRYFSYDNIGNTLSDGKHNFTWNSRLLTSARTNSVTWNYTYNIAGKRVEKQSGTNTVSYFYDDSGNLEYELRTDGSNTNLLYFTYGRDGLEFLTYVQDYGTSSETTQKYWYMKNAQGDIMGLVKIHADGSTSIEAVYYYSSFGEQISTVDASGNAITSTSHISHINPFRYRGYYYDTESNLYYLGSRYYDPEICRFISTDDPSVLTATLDGITDKNLFAYCDNNPIVRADDEGDFWNVVIGAAIGSIVGAASSAITQLLENPEAYKTGAFWGKLTVATVAGGISGGLAATGIGAVGQIAWNTAIGAASSLLDAAIEGETDVGDYALRTLEGATFGAVSGYLGGSGTCSKHVANSFSRALKNHNWSYYFTQTNTQSIRDGLKAIPGILKSVIPNSLKTYIKYNTRQENL